MECNKEEAVRAKGIAENKMKDNDFTGAHKVALRAQRLFPELDGIPQMLTICEVHCSATVMVRGEKDWYGILRVEPTADELSIKRQYRKLAFLLHPDKNKFPGAESAFKLVGEAHMILSGRGKRFPHDIKRSSGHTAPDKQSSAQSNGMYTKKQSGFANNASNTMHHNGPKQQAFSGAQPFGIICPYCGMKYQCCQTALSGSILCGSCKKPCIFYDSSAQAMPQANWSQSGIPPQQFSGQCASQQSNFGTTTSKMGVQEHVSRGSTLSATWSKSRMNEVGGASGNGGKDLENNGDTIKKVEIEVDPGEVNKREQVVKPPAGNSSQKRDRDKLMESNCTRSTDNEDVTETIGPAAQTSDNHLRRSPRMKQNSTCNEEKSFYDDSYFVKHPKPKRSKTSGTSFHAPEGDTAEVKVQSSVTSVFQRKSKKWNGVCAEEKLPNGNKPAGNNQMHQEVDKAGEKKEVSEKLKGADAEEMLPDGNKSVENNEIHQEVDGAGKKKEILNAGNRSNVNTGVDFSFRSSLDVDGVLYPDPEFYDFVKNRDVTQFRVDQIWAVYDNLDGMPRYYALIRKVYALDFKLRINWLEYDPIGETDMKWSDEDLPVACGKYRLGKLQITKDQLMFSHLVSWKKGSRRNSYEIFPRKGEVWALFKNWDSNWSSDPPDNPLQYEVVEVLSDYEESTDVIVIHLVKIEGFVGLFVQATDSRTPLKIPFNEVLRFSHKVPSYKMTGNEREGIPVGSVELDFAALPDNFGDLVPSISLDNIMGGKMQGGGCLGNEYTAGGAKKSKDLNNENASNQVNKGTGVRPEQLPGVKRCSLRILNQSAPVDGLTHEEVEPMANKNQVDKNIDSNSKDAREEVNRNSEVQYEQVPDFEMEVEEEIDSHDTESYPMNSSSPVCYQYPDSEFYSFEEERSSDKFQCGQIWAIYSDEDALPKYYGRIKKVNLGNFKVQVAWLDSHPPGYMEKQWMKKKLPICCGRFKVLHKTVEYFSRDHFSHLVHAKPAARKDQYDILPNIGEVWAVYKNWHVGWTHTELTNCEYDVAEILEVTGSGLLVQVLEKVDGYRAVFCQERKLGVPTKLEIQVAEYLSFSHQIPAFKLTEERGGKLRGYWELDPASLPDVVLFAN